MSVTMQRSLLCLTLLAVVAGSAGAIVQQRNDSPLADRQFLAPALEFADTFSRPDDLPDAARLDSLLRLQNLNVDRSSGILETRGGRWATLYPVIPMIPGNGQGNALTWESLGAEVPADARAIQDLAWSQVERYIVERADSLRIDPSELDHRGAVHNNGELVQFFANRVFNGLPVRGAGFTAVLNHGNLALMGSNAWGDIRVDLNPTFSADEARGAVAKYIAPFAIESLRGEPNLEIVPVGASGVYDIGNGIDHRLVWVFRPDVAGAAGRWEALVDAHSGAMMSFQDLNHYAEAGGQTRGTNRNINGGHYPITYDGIGPEGVMQDNYPMPYADTTVGGPFTDAGGNFTGAGVATTTLVGQFIRIDDQCTGVFNESSAGDIELGGTDGDVDCDTPTSGDNTASARSGFYELNRMVELAQGQLPANGWLMGTLESNMNINNSCNAFWNGFTINFYREGFPCGNTGQIGSVFDHEWGHGMDDNDVQGSVISTSNGGGEGIADVYGSLRLNTSCVGRGFWIDGSVCGGYGDPCTPASGCTGIRDIDWANRTSGVPHDLTFVQTCGCCSSTHCRGSVYAETIWDMLTRDFPTINGDDFNTALEKTTRMTFIGGGILNGWYPPAGSPNANCSATFGYNQFLVADDDNGNVNDGTPNMTVIATAWDRHEIDCSPANGGPTVTDSGCAGNPSTAPVLTASATDMGANLAWSSVGGASSYNVYRTDGIFGCDFGKALVGSTAGTSFPDTGLKNGHPYFYTVIPMGSGGASCFGPASNCAAVGALDIFADGFESGDTSAWSNTIPFTP
jgi:hypothetical protein